ncbi:hypothetical protein [Streptomyces sp. NPDC089919]|uniref:hypothetical protein n=1 Tax=Streptomyces sp. NPDC089919 TaxID=3155188 RepID=UPI00344422C3
MADLTEHVALVVTVTALTMLLTTLLIGTVVALRGLSGEQRITVYRLFVKALRR